MHQPFLLALLAQAGGPAAGSPDPGALASGADWLISGYATAGYSDLADEASSFDAAFNPVFLWRLDERLLAAAELEFRTGGHGHEEDAGASAEVEYAQITWAASDAAVIGAGQFLSPFGTFNERFHPTWINRLPTNPLFADHDGLVPVAMLGAQVRGGVPIGAGVLKYAAFVANGPALNSGTDEPEEAGLLHWDPEADENQNKAVGGRVAWMPAAWLEVGVSGMGADVEAEAASAESLGATLLGADLTAIWSLEGAGSLRLDAEYVVSEVDDATYLIGTPEETLYDNERNGGWVQVAYRLGSGAGPLAALEPVVRWDWMDLPEGAPEDEDVDRLTIGLDWWLGPRAVVKVAFEQAEIGDESAGSFYAQLAVGL